MNRDFIKRLAKFFFKAIDPVIATISLPALFAMRLIKHFGIVYFPITKQAFHQCGIFPIRRHYYEPAFHPADFAKVEFGPRNLPAIDLNIKAQLELLSTLDYAEELRQFPNVPDGGSKPHFFNSNFEEGDAEFWYAFIRKTKPRKIIEVGSGFSTRFAIEAIRRNQIEVEDYTCKIECIEPYEFGWLDEIEDVQVIREKVEDLSIDRFESLESGDILFIDSSHIIRPHGDLLFEYLQILPSLKKGVVVHIHDIFTPLNYPKEWIVDQNRFWNEQYLLEAFLSFNDSFEILAALNYLNHSYKDQLSSVCPILAETKKDAIGSFYIRKK